MCAGTMLNFWFRAKIFIIFAVILVARGEFMISELIVDTLLRYNCSIQFNHEFDLIPKNASGLRLAFSPNHEIDFRRWTIPALPLLEVLEIDVSYIPQPVPHELFSNYGHLGKLSVYHHLHSVQNFRAELSARLFRGFDRLTALNLPSLGLESLPGGVLDGLTDLKTLDLNQNQLTALPNGTFRSCCGRMISLNLARNRLLEIPSLVNLPSLRQLNLYSNGITRIYTESFDDLKNLAELNLDDNRLELIESGAFGRLVNLKRLYADGNRIENLTMDVFEGLTALEQLDLSQNRISELKNATFQPLKSLRELSLNRNRLRFIEPGAFQGLTQLLMLELAENSITSLDGSSFAGLDNLQYLNLQSVGLSNLSYDVFGATPLLSELYLSKNSLKSLPEQIFATTKNLRVVDISENPWNCDCKLIAVVRKFNDLSEILLENRPLTFCSSPESVKNVSIYDLEMLTVTINGSCAASPSATTRLAVTTATHIKVTTDFTEMSTVTTATHFKVTTDLTTVRNIDKQNHEYELNENVVTSFVVGLIGLLFIVFGSIYVFVHYRHYTKWTLWKN